MPRIYHLNKKQTAAFVKKDKGYYVTSIKHHLTPESIRRHSPYLPSHIYVRDDRLGSPHKMLVWKSNVLQPSEGWVYGDVIFQYGDKTYNKLPADYKLTDEQFRNIDLYTLDYIINNMPDAERDAYQAFDYWTPPE